MSTRKRTDGEAPTQQGYASSAEHGRGLLANLVAMRCEALDSAADKELVFALQYVSHQPGGLARFAEELIAWHPEQIATPSMQRLGFNPGQVYRAEQVREVRGEIPHGRDRFLLKGEFAEYDPIQCEPEIIEYEELGTGRKDRRFNSKVLEAKMAANVHPSCYPAEDFVRACRDAVCDHLASRLEKMCLDPATKIEGRWYFPNLIPVMRAHFARRTDEIAKGLADTITKRQVFEALDYSLAADGITFIEGLARTGKTYSLKAWCEQRPGAARYIQVPPTNDDLSFYRRIAEALGVSSGLSMKSTQLRDRVERTARSAKLVLVFDEAHAILSQDYRCRRRPTRIAWLMNELVNYGVPVVLCATPQFMEDKVRIQERTGWAWEQFDGRIGHFTALERILAFEELLAVARVHLPDVEEEALFGVAKYAQASSSYVGGIEHVVKRARYLAQKEGRSNVTTRDVTEAIKARLSLDMRGKVASPLIKEGGTARLSDQPQENLDRAMQPGQAAKPGNRPKADLQVC